MFDIGIQELVLIFVIALLVFGPKNLPQLGRSLGRAMREFRRASAEFESTIRTNLQFDEPDPLPAPPSVTVDTSTATTEATTPGTGETEALADSALDPHAVSPTTSEAPPGEAYVAQRGSRLFHQRDCAWVKRIGELDRVYFKRVAEAKEAGFMACPSCEPWEPA
jgi:TatA/E family protein of Tat protein translocase